MTILNSVLLALSASVLTSPAIAEIVPMTDCVNCQNSVTNPDAPECEWEDVCDRTTSTSFTGMGADADYYGGVVQCINCPSYNGNPCSEHDEFGAGISCSVSADYSHTLAWSIDSGASGGINILIFNEEFNVSIGRSSSKEVSRTASGTLNAPHCRRVAGDGHFMVTEDATAVATVSYTHIRTGEGPHPRCKAYYFPCDGGSVKATYDAKMVAVTIRSLSNDSCGSGQ